MLQSEVTSEFVGFSRFHVEDRFGDSYVCSGQGVVVAVEVIFGVASSALAFACATMVFDLKIFLIYE